MSVQRCAQPLISPSHHIFKFLSVASNTTLRVHPHGFRTFNSVSRLRQSSKRKLQTATAYRPPTLDSISPPPPPRNAGVPETSITAALPEVNDTRPPPPPPPSRSIVFPSLSTPKSQAQTAENEAQKSNPVPEPPTVSKRSRLRARKAAMSLTPSATTQLRNLLSLPEPKMIRIGVKNRGCSGLAYNLEYVEKAGAFDETVEQDGVKVLIDSKALFSIIGSEMDWIEDKLSQRFVFRNPNIKEQCGCGESFMV